MDIEDLKKHRVGVLGFGQEGKAVTTYLLQHGITPVLFDRWIGQELNAFDRRSGHELSNEEKQYIKDNGLQTFFGQDYLQHLDQVDVVFRSPGIWRLTPELVEAEKKGLIITSQIKWFFDHCRVPIVGVTGTKGKGTTASLIAHIINSEGKRKAYLTGNVGQIQPLEILEQLHTEDMIVYELSSFQLQDMDRSPHIGVVLMVTQDHLEVHGSLDEYHHAKDAIVKFQNTDDIAIINDDFEASKTIGSLGLGKKIYFSRHHELGQGAFIKEGQIVIRLERDQERKVNVRNLRLRGEHNWDNAAAGILASLSAGVDPLAIPKALQTFEGLPHRLQQLQEQNGIQFFDDSISTAPDTVVAAVKSFAEPIIIIVGGLDKKLDPTPLINVLVQTPNVKAVVAIGTTGPTIADSLRARQFQGQLLEGFKNMAEAMKAIKSIAQPGDAVLLSPGYYSFDWYENYKQRGDHFAQLAAQWETL